MIVPDFSWFFGWAWKNIVISALSHCRVSSTVFFYFTVWSVCGLFIWFMLFGLKSNVKLNVAHQSYRFVYGSNWCIRVSDCSGSVLIFNIYTDPNNNGLNPSSVGIPYLYTLSIHTGVWVVVSCGSKAVTWARHARQCVTTCNFLFLLQTTKQAACTSSTWSQISINLQLRKTSRIQVSLLRLHWRDEQEKSRTEMASGTWVLYRFIMIE